MTSRVRFQKLTIKDNFMFSAIMSEPEQCQKVLSRILGKKILQVSVITEKTLVYHPEHKGVRLDVWAEEAGTHRHFNVEMQVRKDKNLPRRSRYYHAHMDVNALAAGADYDELPDTYVIFICDFALFEDDVFGKNKKLYRYHFRNTCVETGTILSDGCETIFLSTKGENDDEVPKELVSFLKYVGNPELADKLAVDDDFVADLHAQVASIKQNWKVEEKFMIWDLLLRDERKEGREEGREEGLEEGREFKIY